MYTTLTIGDNEYKLRLTADSCMELEKKFDGKNPIIVLGSGLVTVTDTISILHASMQKFHHGITRKAAADLYDLYIDEGGSYFDLLDVLTAVFEVSGFFKPAPTEEPTEQNQSE